MISSLLNSYPIQMIGSATIFICIILQAILFFLSIKKTFIVFVVTALAQTAFLAYLWSASLEELSIRNQFLAPLAVTEDLPVTISEGVTLEGLSWNGASLSHRYQITSEYLIPVAQLVQSETCRGTTRVSALALGATLRHEYYLGGQLITAFDVDLLDCFRQQ